MTLLVVETLEVEQPRNGTGFSFCTACLLANKASNSYIRSLEQTFSCLMLVSQWQSHIEEIHLQIRAQYQEGD